MAEIKISSNEIRSAATQLASLKQQFGQELNEINQIMAQVDSFWDGPASEEFLSRYNALQHNFADYQTVIDEYRAFLLEAATAYEGNEATLKNQATQDLNNQSVFHR